MFKVKHIRTGAVFTVYGLNGLLFLFYDQDDGWLYVPMEDYKPVEEG